MPISNPSFLANSPKVGGVGVGVNVGVLVEVGKGVIDGVAIGSGNFVTSTPQAERANPAEVTPAIFRKSLRVNLLLLIYQFPLRQPANGLRYLRWGGDGEAVQPEK